MYLHLALGVNARCGATGDFELSLFIKIETVREDLTADVPRVRVKTSSRDSV